MDLLEYKGKQVLKRYDVPLAAGEPARTVDEAVDRGRRRRLPGRRQGAGEDRRPREGGRDQARRGRRRGARARRGDPRDGHPRPHRARAVDRGGDRHRQRVLRRHRLRPLGEVVARDALHAGRHGHRAGRRRATRRRWPRCTSTRSSAFSPSTAAAWRSRRASTPTSCGRSATCSPRSTPPTPARTRRSSRSTRSSSRPTAASSRSTRRSRSTTTPPSATPTTPRSTTPATPIRRSRWPRSAG